MSFGTHTTRALYDVALIPAIDRNVGDVIAKADGTLQVIGPDGKTAPAQSRVLTFRKGETTLAAGVGSVTWTSLAGGGPVPFPAIPAGYDATLIVLSAQTTDLNGTAQIGNLTVANVSNGGADITSLLQNATPANDSSKIVVYAALVSTATSAGF